jgi:hypothetical protein
VGTKPGSGESDAVAPALVSPGIDATGQALPLSDTEWAARQARLTEELAAIDAGDDTPDDVYGAFLRHVDEERRNVGRPPAFGGAT